MPSVQLERLRPQINAIITQYENSETFTRSLISLLKSYSGDIDHSSSQISAYSLIPRLNVPQIVLNQLEISLKYLARTYPSQTKSIVEKLWEEQFFEPKIIALALLSNLHAQERDFYFEKINIWVDADIEGPIIDVILENAIKNKDIFESKRWLALVEEWLVTLIQSLIKASQPETAAFLIHLSIMYPKPEVYALIRKCMSFFDQYYASEISKKLATQ
jgi:hypothetical protein